MSAGESFWDRLLKPIRDFFESLPPMSEEDRQRHDEWERREIEARSLYDAIVNKTRSIPDSFFRPPSRYPHLSKKEDFLRYARSLADSYEVHLLQGLLTHVSDLEREWRRAQTSKTSGTTGGGTDGGGGTGGGGDTAGGGGGDTTLIAEDDKKSQQETKNMTYGFIALIAVLVVVIIIVLLRR